MAATIVASNGIVNEVLTKDNYDNWSVLVRNYLLGLGLWDVVEGVYQIDDEDRAQYEIWRRENAKALHIIQLACGSDILAQFKHLETAKDSWNYLKASFGSDVDQGLVQNNPRLHRSVKKGDWNAAKSFIEGDETGTAVFSTNSWGRTALHVAVIAGHGNIVEKLVEEGKDTLVKVKDSRGYTALALAADLTGNTEIAKCMVESMGEQDLHDLLTMETKDGVIPVLLAASKGHKQMTRYLYSKTPLDALVDGNAHNGVSLLTRCITSQIVDVAWHLLNRSREAQLLTHESDTLRPLKALASMPSLFPSGTRLSRLQYFFYDVLFLRPETKLQYPYGISIEIVSHVAQDEGRHRTSLSVNDASLAGLCRLFLRLFPGIREIYDLKLKHRLVLEILSCMSRRISDLGESQLQEASAFDAMLDAAKHGIIEFIDSMRKANPELLCASDKNKRNIFSYAILNRRKWVLQLINIVNEKEMITSHVDAFGNTLLHLAGHLRPSPELDRISGAALKMQRELQWFKQVEGIVNPNCKEAKNADGKTPAELFRQNHKELMQAGEKWTKEAANSFALVATLITSIMFAAAITVPGGNNQETGVPIFSHDKRFVVFIIADAISIIYSSFSILAFLQIVTSRFAETDFLNSLPSLLRSALMALNVSVVSMIVAFCAALAIIVEGDTLLVMPTISLASSLVMIVVLSQLRLFYQE